MASVYSVSQVNSYIKNMFVQDYALCRISIKGEVSNCKYHSSGHIYFTLKDKTGTLSAVMFASQRKGLTFQLKEGQQVIAKGSVDVYERDGKYQLYANEITLDGTGDLFRKFQELRDELEEMGMFAPEYKVPIPEYAKTIGIVTAQTGAAIRDIINISQRRNPYVQLILYPALVQGDGAKQSIVSGIKTLDAMNTDIIIVGRGGGSIEDLWAFNEEEVARAIFECNTPVISAVGHETDVTIADYVADLRAPTPSAAAELAVFDYLQYEDKISRYKDLLNKSILRELQHNKYKTDQYSLRLKIYNPHRQINEKRQRLADIQERIENAVKSCITEKRHRLALLSGRLQGLSPLEKISRGYGFITDKNNIPLKSVKQVQCGEQIRVCLKDGHLDASIIDMEEKP